MAYKKFVFHAILKDVKSFGRGLSKVRSNSLILSSNVNKQIK